MNSSEISLNPCTIIDCGLGNINSVANMVRRIGLNTVIASSPTECPSQGPLILPGVGSFDFGITQLENTGFKDYLLSLSSDRLLIGICLGMQLMFDSSEEGSMRGLSLLPGKVRKFAPINHEFKVPHMGWNRTHINPSFPGFTTVLDNSRFYFVHSYHIDCDSKFILSHTDYIKPFPSSVISNNIIGFQFHPEKSHSHGLKLLSYTLNLYTPQSHA